MILIKDYGYSLSCLFLNCSLLWKKVLEEYEKLSNKWDNVLKIFYCVLNFMLKVFIYNVYM